MGELISTYAFNRNAFKRNLKESADSVVEHIDLVQEQAQLSKGQSNIVTALANSMGIFARVDGNYQPTNLADVFLSLYEQNPQDAWQWLATRSLWLYCVPNGTQTPVNTAAEERGIEFNFFNLILGVLLHLQALPSDHRFLYYEEFCAIFDADEAWALPPWQLFERIISEREEALPYDRGFLDDLEPAYNISRDNYNGLFNKAFRQTGLFDFATKDRTLVGIAISSHLDPVLQRRMRHILDNPVCWTPEEDWSTYLAYHEEDLPIEVATETFDDEVDLLPVTVQPEYSTEDFSEETGIGMDVIDSWVRRLQQKQHVIFQGPPGTGKTFIAEKMARRLVSETTGLWQTIQFHPTYSYEEFIQGIRPDLAEDGNLGYELKKGRFLEFCEAASAEEVAGSPCVLIIDEINRAHLSRVFGELMYLLEYRKRSIPLATGGKQFQIPPNVYIIGTMNTADRSIALVDYALRRRFTFIRLEPDYELLRSRLSAYGYDGDSLIDVLKEVNILIDDPNYEVGTSYFLANLADLNNLLPDIWQGEIEPYLEEFFFDQPEQVDPYRWVNLREKQLSNWRQH